MNRPLLLTCRLAVKDWLDDRLISLCGVLTLASVLAPLLILFGVRFGVVEGMRDRLLQDPAILTITPVGSGSYTDEWLREITAMPEVIFGTLTTRSLAATMQLSRTPQKTRAISPDITVSVLPTGTTDPLLTHNDITFRGITDDSGRDPVVLSHSAARKLNVGPGDVVYGRIQRKTPSGAVETATLPLWVVDVLPLEAEDKDVAYAALSLLETLDDYRNYVAVAQRLFTGNPQPVGPRQYPSFRLSVRSLDDVAILRDKFQAKNIETYTRARDIDLVKNLDASLTLVFWLIALTASAGFLAATTSTVLASVRRKVRHLGMLRLMGLPGVPLFPVVQALLTGFWGTLLAGGLYLATSTAINHLFAEQTQGYSVCRLYPSHFLMALLIVMVLSGLAALKAARQTATIDPSDVIREI